MLYSKYGTFETIPKRLKWSLKGSISLSCEISDLCSHGAGVVSLLTLSDTLFLTGSYDNCLRSFDYRNLKRPISSIDLDGGVWRILPRPNSTPCSFLACCMQFGAQLVSLNQEVGSFERFGAFEPQEDRRLIYGASWHSESIAALCSFYEKKLYICRIP
jgi:diphthine methyl ester acylhydrolase